MDEVMGITLHAMQADAFRLERVGANLANALTPGYKREVMVQRADAASPGPIASFAGLLEQHVASTTHADRPVPTMTRVSRDIRNGTLKSTGQNLDLALSGRGFFEVQTPEGPAYTRHGQFHLDALGRLVTAAGHPVMGKAGDIALAPGPVSIDASGAISQSGHALGQLNIVAFEHPSDMPQLDGNLLGAASHPAVLDGADVQVHQGYLENANVNAMHEMVELMQAMRHFESMHRVIQSYDDMLGSAIRKLGDI